MYGKHYNDPAINLWDITYQRLIQSDLSVIRQRGESENSCFKKTKHAKFSEKRTFPTPWYAVLAYKLAS